MKRTFFYILIRSRKAYANFDRCIDSVYFQNYRNYKIIYVDDASPLTKIQRSHIKKRLKGHITVFNKKRFYSLKNAFFMLHKYAVKEDAVVFNLDGDDWLPDKNCLKVVAGIYDKSSDCFLTYGDCLIADGSGGTNASAHLRSNTNIYYPAKIVRKNEFRRHPFLPLHPRTWKVWLYKKIKKEDFLNSNGSWIKYAEDQAIFYPMLEMAGGKYKVIKKPIYVYNNASTNSDINENLIDLYKDEIIIRRKAPYAPLN